MSIFVVLLTRRGCERHMVLDDFRRIIQIPLSMRWEVDYRDTVAPSLPNIVPVREFEFYYKARDLYHYRERE